MPLRLLALVSRLADAPGAEVVVCGASVSTTSVAPPPPPSKRSPSPSNPAVAEFDSIGRSIRAGPTWGGGGDEAARAASPPPPEERDRAKHGGGGTPPSASACALPFHTRPEGPGRYLLVGHLDAALDLTAAAGMDGVLLAGTAGPADIERLGARLAVVEAEAGLADGALRIVPIVETARGALSLPTFLPTPRLAGIACGPHRLATSLGCAADAPAIAQTRATTVLAAAACGVPAILVVNDGGDEAAVREGFAAILLDDRV